MIATHSVKINGKWYKAGEEISPAFSEENNEIEKSNYTKTEINRMSTGDLRILATEQGIENAEETSGADLKKMLIEKFEL